VTIEQHQPRAHELPNKTLKQPAAPRRDLNGLPVALGDVPRARSPPPAASRFPDAAAA
jgi:hypothetical protein